MTDESHRFHTTGLTWSERANLDGLRTVLSPFGADRRNLFLHGIHLFAAKRANRLGRGSKRVLDFGCGAGRFVRFFAEHGWKVYGTEITSEMIMAAEREGLPSECNLYLTDGISVPLPANSVDLIWCCAVLRYSLLVPDPAYDEIAMEMFRVLRPGGSVVNMEMYVEQKPEVFIGGFERAGFVTKETRVVHRYNGGLETLLTNRHIPTTWMGWMAQSCAQIRYRVDNPSRAVQGLRDYLFVWRKPA
jgi:SAM-dependent methyltransferase